MILGDNREAVIENIKSAAQSGDFYRKVELNDPVLTDEEANRITDRYLENRKKASFRIKSHAARTAANILTSVINKNTEIEGLENMPEFPNGAIVTSNHFSPVENTVIRYFVKKCKKKKLNIVSQVTNLAMPGVLGFLMNYADVIPLSGNFHYMERDFPAVLKELLDKGEAVLIYPEQEMWFNYRKPRPPKIGAYHYAAKLNVPVVSFFVETVDLDEKDTESFNKVRFILHVLGVIYPDPEKSVHANSIEMSEKDYALKKAAYEKAYNKPLTYEFDSSDIAGWLGDR
ncbi:MAG: lysophospholipid acyltransferase family protein [Clostridia bacterium]|nr:lysophospholipid acyltransferase family protein [Clostridia bacterium]